MFKYLTDITKNIKPRFENLRVLLNLGRATLADRAIRHRSFKACCKFFYLITSSVIKT